MQSWINRTFRFITELLGFKAIIKTLKYFIYLQLFTHVPNKNQIETIVIVNGFIK